MSSLFAALGFGLRRQKKGKTLDVWFPNIYFSTEDMPELFEICQPQAGKNAFYPLAFEQLKRLWDIYPDLLFGNLSIEPPSEHAYAQTDMGFFFLSQVDQPVETPEEAYFKLQMISQRHVKPHGVNLDGAFRVLQNLAWTQKGPVLLEDLDQERFNALLRGEPLSVSHVDKFPYLVNYHIPSGVRIASGSQVRLGAYLGEGTTVMPAGYVNFNAGTEGQAMIEGRVSAGVFVGDKSDVGGGASIMGTLSGGNQHVISIGSQCLLGANAGTGISLGDGCTLAAGTYVTAGTKLSLYDLEHRPINLAGELVSEGENMCKAEQVSGRSYLLFYQDSQTGQMVCKPNRKTIALNRDLHVHN